MAQVESKPPAAWLAIKPYFNGGVSGMAATCIVQPIDMVKVRIQLGATGGPVSEGGLLHPEALQGVLAQLSLWSWQAGVAA